MGDESCVYIVHAVDTEGPLYEGLEGCFNQLKEQFNIVLAPSMSNIMKLRNKEIDVGGNEELLAKFVSEERIGRYKGTWDQLDKMHETFMSSEWRAKFKDSAGKPYVVSWYCMDHVGYENNPRRRAMGYHAVYDYYKDKLNEFGLSRDKIYWHYHPMSFSHDAHRMGYNYSYNANVHNEILCRRIIDRNWFPASNRPGGHIESYDISAWLEAWIPFDLANQSMDVNNDLSGEEMLGRVPGRHGDWRGATSDWQIYNPDLYDYRKKGNMKRSIGRCLNMNSRHSNLTRSEIERAFDQAAMGKSVLMSYTNHDFRDMIQETEETCSQILDVAKTRKDVTFRWANAVEAFRAVLGYERSEPIKLDVDLNGSLLNVVLQRGTIWGVQPFLAIKNKAGNYLHDNFIVNNNKSWTFSFDADSLMIESVDKIGVAANDSYGNVYLCVLDVNKSTKVVEIINDNDWI